MICKLLYKLNLFDSVKCIVLPTSVCLEKIKYNNRTDNLDLTYFF